MYLFYFLAVVGPNCCKQAFSSCREWALLFIAVCGVLVAVVFFCCGVWALGKWASVVATQGLSSCGL